MNAITRIQPVAHDAEWADIHHAVHAWRGEAMHWFAFAETAVTEALLALSQDAAHGAMVRKPHLFRQRMDSLADAIGADGPFADAGRKALPILAAFRDHEELRSLLSHGALKSFRDRDGRWLVMLRNLSFRSGKAVRSARALEQKEAEQLLASLKQDAQTLASALQSMRDKLRPKASSAQA